jgi:lipoprotein-anchoring transpeptidase ErfK/SrfK
MVAGLLALVLALTACTTDSALPRGGDGSGGQSSTGSDLSSGSATGGDATDSGADSAPVTVPSLTPTQDPGEQSSTAEPTDPTTDPATSSTPTETTGSAPPTSSTPAAPVAKVTATPAFGSTGVSVLAPFTVTVAHGTITDFTLTNPDGKVVEGALSDDGRSWKLGEVLGYGKKYTATGTAKGSDGKTVPIKGSFTTITPNSTVRARINIGDGGVVGVAAPIIVTFGGVNPKDRALIEKHISVTTEPKVTGSWGWINHDGGIWGLDFRTKDFWPANTKVHVDVNIYGLDFGDGRYGHADITSDFTIGRNQVVYADVNSHHLVVKRDGKVFADYPASYGRGTDHETTTRSGVHVINEFFELKLMSNPRYGYRNFPAKWAVRISNNGEFIHANEGTVGDQGNTNVSHGCVNLSLANAEKFYKSSLYGDPVIITGTNVQLGPSDGDIFDWAIPWSTWVTLSALN